MHHPPPYIETSKGHRIEKGAVSKFKDRGTELKKKKNPERERETRSHLIPRRRTVRRTSRPVAAPFSLPAHAGMVVARTRGDKATGGDRERRDSTVQSVDVDADARLCNFFSSWSWWAGLQAVEEESLERGKKKEEEEEERRLQGWDDPCLFKGTKFSADAMQSITKRTAGQRHGNPARKRSRGD
jgi:hypothetical protein